MCNELPNLEHIESGIRNYDEILQSNPSNYDAWHMHGYLLCKLKRYEEAIASYDKAIEAKHDYAASWYERGLAFTALGRFEAAVSSYDEFCKFKPDDYKAWLERGRILYRLCRYGQARLSFNRATQLQPDLPVVWYWYGVAVEATGYYEKALSSLDKALELAPNFPYILASRARVLRKLGQYEIALVNYDRAIQQNQVLKGTSNSSLYQKFESINHRSTLPLSLIYNPMRSLNISEFSYTAEKIDYRTEGRSWFLSLGDGKPDLYILGSTEHLDQEHLSLAEEILLQVEDLELSAIAYLEKFTNRIDAGTYGDSYVVSVSCGFIPDYIEVAIAFDTDGDGLWYVGFSSQELTAWRPVSFGRQTY